MTQALEGLQGLIGLQELQGFNKNLISFLAIHHSGGTASDPLASSQNLSWEQVNEAHRVRPKWIGYKAHLSKLGYYGGYNAFIDNAGNIKQFRYIGEETLAQFSHNLDTISICLAGNFSKTLQGVVEMPTKEQVSALTSLLVWAQNVYNIMPENIVPHRNLQAGTECYGSAMGNNWARGLIAPQLKNKQNILMGLIQLYRQLIQLLSTPKLGAGRTPCSELRVIG
jgi:hypothetical protein